MKFYYYLALFAFLTALPQSSASMKVSADSLSMRGDYRYVYRMFFKLYDAKLYTNAPEATRHPDALSGQYALSLEFSYLRTINKSIILESADKMLERNLSEFEYAQIADRVARINRAYTTVEKGDVSSLTFTPGEGTTLAINGDDKVTLEGDDFAQLYFEIWLGDRPISESMRDSLLGLKD